ncbi:transcriptional activator [Xylariaceae sp. FL0016]|nr:transcriptional activator [Xylariaceae sp. FL0016]
MAFQANTGKAGVIKASDDAGSMDQLTHAVLDDLLYNIVHDLLIKVHRDEKIARAATAAIRVEKLASDASDSNTDARPEVKVETDAAVYDEGKVLLKGNPLTTTKDILCPSCHLPRLLYPTDGKGARKPDPSIIYCKKYPYIDKPGYDIYGQTWVAQGPGRGKKKKDMEKKLEPTSDSPTPTPDGGSTGGGAASRPPNMLSFPSATCSKCKRCILVTRLNNHMGSCIGNSGRNASRAAAQKISNGGDGTPPGSQKGTPVSGSRANSPKKRDGDEMDDDDETDNDAHKKKKLKPSPASVTNKKLVVKKAAGGGGLKKEKVKTGSSLNIEQKVDDEDAEGSTVEVAPKKKVTKVPSPAKKLKLGTAKPPLGSPMNKNVGKNSSNGGGADKAAAGGGGDDGESDSSGTLSSPPII